MHRPRAKRGLRGTGGHAASGGGRRRRGNAASRVPTHSPNGLEECARGSFFCFLQGEARWEKPEPLLSPMPNRLNLVFRVMGSFRLWSRKPNWCLKLIGCNMFRSFDNREIFFICSFILEILLLDRILYSDKIIKSPFKLYYIDTNIAVLS